MIDYRFLFRTIKVFFNRTPVLSWIVRKMKKIYFNWCILKNINNEAQYNKFVMRKESNESFKNIVFNKKKYISDIIFRASQKSPDFVPLMEDSINLQEKDIKLIAYYLPQFHPIPENDLWWGKGFTEWTNVTNAVPQFVGHYQPHLPGELGFYDLRIIDIQKRQIELAKKYGIYGFCYYHYWFSGKQLLESPMKQILENPELNFPFCLCWANENWTRRWDGLENEILIAQNYLAGDDLAFIKNIEPALKDYRYIKISGKPLIMIYAPGKLPNVKNTIEIWREYCKSVGIGDIYLVMVSEPDLLDPMEYGFDAAAEFPPHGVDCANITSMIQIINPKYTGNIRDLKTYVRLKKYLNKPQYKLFKSVFTSWDNTARRPNNGIVFWGSTPSIYKEWLTNIVRYTEQNNAPEEKIVFINAWNEWAEGAHLEPDRKYGYAYLQATAEVILENRKTHNDIC